MERVTPVKGSISDRKARPSFEYPWGALPLMHDLPTGNSFRTPFKCRYAVPLKYCPRNDQPIRQICQVDPAPKGSRTPPRGAKEPGERIPLHTKCEPRLLPLVRSEGTAFAFLLQSRAKSISLELGCAGGSCPRSNGVGSDWVNRGRCRGRRS